MLTETLSQYSALMVMKHAPDTSSAQATGGLRPREDVRRFLRYELDSYLQGRALERKKEVPLYRVENQQYIHYAKGSLVMYALQDYLGEAVVNRVLAEYLAGREVQRAAVLDLRRTSSRRRFRCRGASELKYLIEDLFERTILYDNRALEATSDEDPRRPLPRGCSR